MEKSYDIFISYSRANLKKVSAIKDEVERQTGANCWMDLEGIESGAPRFTKSLIDGINDCSILLFMRSEASQISEYALRELNYASKKDKHVVIVNVDSSTMTDEFLFLYGLTDTIDWSNTAQREKLMRDICKWTGKSAVSLGTFAQGPLQADDDTQDIRITNKLEKEGKPRPSTRTSYNPNVYYKIVSIIVDKLGVDESEVVPEASFINDFGCDSLDAVELIMEFEKEFGIAIPDDEAAEITTVGAALKYIEEHT